MLAIANKCLWSLMDCEGVYNCVWSSLRIFFWNINLLTLTSCGMINKYKHLIDVILNMLKVLYDFMKLSLKPADNCLWYGWVNVRLGGKDDCCNVFWIHNQPVHIINCPCMQYVYSPETQIENGLLKWQFPFQNNICYSGVMAPRRILSSLVTKVS